MVKDVVRRRTHRKHRSL